MENQFILAKNGSFVLNNKKIMLKGFVIGSWMDLENFMVRIPGTDKTIKQAFAEVYGKENAEQFFDDYLYYYITEDDFIYFKKMGINVIRLAFDYRHFIDDQVLGKIKDEGFKHIDRVLDLCRKYGIFAILDLHSSPGGQNPDGHGGGETGVSRFWEDAASREKIINLWGYIAKRYKDDLNIAGYDILNEPCYISNVDAFNDFYDSVIVKIRDVDNNHIIFLEGEDWAKDFSVFRKLGGYQQAISFHFYPGQHVYMTTEREKRRQQLADKLSYFTGLREKTGMPLWVGETGGYFPSSKMEEGLELVKDCLDLFEKNEISWTIWAHKDTGAMGILYPKSDMKWAQMASEFRYQWQHKSRSNATIANEVYKSLEEKFSYSINEDLKEKLKFRIFAFLNEVHINQLVKPKLLTIPWEEIIEYPKSFSFNNCDQNEGLFELVKSYNII